MYRSNNYHACSLIRFQNRVFASITEGLRKGKTFDQGLIAYFSNRDSSLAEDLIRERTDIEHYYQSVARFIELRDVQNQLDSIMDEDCQRYYIQEIALRGNMASSSDILRLNILYRQGGVYVDCDTLPDLDHIFPESNRYCLENNISSLYVDVLKSELYLRNIEPFLQTIDCGQESPKKLEQVDLEFSTVSSFVQGCFGSLYDIMMQECSPIAPNFFEEKIQRPCLKAKCFPPFFKVCINYIEKTKESKRKYRINRILRGQNTLGLLSYFLAIVSTILENR